MRGFTLLEMLVVLVMLGLLMGLVGPSFVHQLETAETRSTLSQFEAELLELPRRVRLSGEPLLLEELTSSLVFGHEDVLSLPHAWTARFTPALSITTIQTCSASEIVLLRGTQEMARYRIEELSCALTLVES